MRMLLRRDCVDSVCVFALPPIFFLLPQEGGKSVPTATSVLDFGMRWKERGKRIESVHSMLWLLPHYVFFLLLFLFFPHALCFDFSAFSSGFRILLLNSLYCSTSDSWSGQRREWASEFCELFDCKRQEKRKREWDIREWAAVKRTKWSGIRDTGRSLNTVCLSLTHNTLCVWTSSASVCDSVFFRFSLSLFFFFFLLSVLINVLSLLVLFSCFPFRISLFCNSELLEVASGLQGFLSQWRRGKKRYQCPAGHECYSDHTACVIPLIPTLVPSLFAGQKTDFGDRMTEKGLRIHLSSRFCFPDSPDVRRRYSKSSAKKIGWDWDHETRYHIICGMREGENWSRRHTPFDYNVFPWRRFEMILHLTLSFFSGSSRDSFSQFLVLSIRSGCLFSSDLTVQSMHHWILYGRRRRKIFLDEGGIREKEEGGFWKRVTDFDPLLGTSLHSTDS